MLFFFSSFRKLRAFTCVCWYLIINFFSTFWRRVTFMASVSKSSTGVVAFLLVESPHTTFSTLSGRVWQCQCPCGWVKGISSSSYNFQDFFRESYYLWQCQCPYAWVNRDIIQLIHLSVLFQGELLFMAVSVPKSFWGAAFLLVESKGYHSAIILSLFMPSAVASFYNFFLDETETVLR